MEHTKTTWVFLMSYYLKLIFIELEFLVLLCTVPFDHKIHKRWRSCWGVTGEVRQLVSWKWWMTCVTEKYQYARKVWLNKKGGKIIKLWRMQFPDIFHRKIFWFWIFFSAMHEGGGSGRMLLRLLKAFNHFTNLGIYLSWVTAWVTALLFILFNLKI